MKKMELKLRKRLRILLGGISLTAAAFVFHACYGMPPDNYDDVQITGTVRSKTTLLPVKGIKVMANDEGYNFGITDKDGKFDFYSSVPNFSYSKDDIHYSPENVRINFLDIDGIENGHFSDTTITVNRVNKNQIIINVDLTEKQ